MCRLIGPVSCLNQTSNVSASFKPSIVFAFLVASYLAAHKLRQSVVVVALFLFTLVSFICTFVNFRISEGTIAILRRMRIDSEAGLNDLEWFPGTEVLINDNAAWLFPALFVLAYLASMVFFFMQRRSGINR